MLWILALWNRLAKSYIISSMQPDAPQSPTPPPAPPPVVPKAGQNPYDFITNPEASSRRGLSLKGENKTQKLLIIIVGVLLVFTIVAFLIFAVLGSSVSNKDQLVALAKQQNELIRVADVGVQKSRTAEAKNLAVTAKLTFTSQQQPLLETLAKQKVKIGTKQLAPSTQTEISQKNQTDQKLTAAEQNNSFDEIFVVVLSEQLKDYQLNLKAAHDNTQNKKIKALLSEQFKNASLFIN